jgi:hypothetical protein
LIALRASGRSIVMIATWPTVVKFTEGRVWGSVEADRSEALIAAAS